MLAWGECGVADFVGQLIFNAAAEAIRSYSFGQHLSRWLEALIGSVRVRGFEGLSQASNRALHHTTN